MVEKYLKQNYKKVGLKTISCEKNYKKIKQIKHKFKACFMLLKGE